jgi:hypothetical protein
MGVGFGFHGQSWFLSDLGFLKWEIKMLKCGDLGGSSLVDEPETCLKLLKSGDNQMTKSCQAAQQTSPLVSSVWVPPSLGLDPMGIPRVRYGSSGALCAL